MNKAVDDADAMLNKKRTPSLCVQIGALVAL